MVKGARKTRPRFEMVYFPTIPRSGNTFTRKVLVASDDWSIVRIYPRLLRLIGPATPSRARC
eukprot:809544-Prorocentrum_minimum.AAC.2